MRYADASWRTAYTGASSARRGRAVPVVLAVALALLPIRGQARRLAPLVPGTPTALSGKVVRMSQKPAVTL
jgi:hypothetical protein